MGDFKSLEVWRRAHALVLETYAATWSFPPAELYGLTGQIRRAAISVAANIAEGSRRGSDVERVRFCRIALGSASEVEYYLILLILARDLNLLPEAEQAPLNDELLRIMRMLTGLARSLRSTGPVTPDS